MNARILALAVVLGATGTVVMQGSGPSVVLGQGLAQNPDWAFVKTAR